MTTSQIGAQTPQTDRAREAESIKPFTLAEDRKIQSIRENLKTIIFRPEDTAENQKQFARLITDSDPRLLAAAINRFGFGLKSKNPLIYAVEYGKKQLVQMMAVNGAELEPQDGCSPFSGPIQRGNLDMIQYLLRLGFTPTQSDVEFALCKIRPYQHQPTTLKLDQIKELDQKAIDIFKNLRQATSGDSEGLIELAQNRGLGILLDERSVEIGQLTLIEDHIKIPEQKPLAAAPHKDVENDLL